MRQSSLQFTLKKRFIALAPDGVHLIKLFYVINYAMAKISLSVCLWQASQPSLIFARKDSLPKRTQVPNRVG
jgi:hypothetical protein